MTFTFLKPQADTPKPIKKPLDKSAKVTKTEKTKISQLKFDKKFLEGLLSKLTIGNGQSLHLNAVPGKRNTRLDLMDLSVSVEEQDLFGSANSDDKPKKKKIDKTAHEFLNVLLTKDKFRFPISWDNKNQTKMPDDLKQALAIVSKRLDSIVMDNEDMYLETGIKNFGFGYPLLVKPDRKDPKKMVIAPILIWSLDIEKSNRKNEWVISKDEDSPIKVNELLISHIENDEKISLPTLTPDDLEDNVLSEGEVIDYLGKLFKKLGINEKIEGISLDNCPTKDKIESITSGSAWIQWSGIFGLYRSQKEPIIEATRDLLTNIDIFNAEDLEIEPFQTTTTTSFDTDPSQSEIINTLNNDEFKIIQGPPGTGKSQAISAIISNALANGAKTLVVCEKKTALDVLANNLQKQKLDTFCIVVDDVAKDRRQVVEKARRLQEYNPPVKNFDEEAFKLNHSRYTALKEQVNNLYKQSSKPIFAGNTWKDIVGKFLQYSKSENFNNLKTKLSKIKFKFTPEEIESYISNIRMGDLLFTEVKDVNGYDFALLDLSAFGETISIKEKKDIEQKIEKAQDIISSTKAFLNKSNYTANDFSISTKVSVIESEIVKMDSGLDIIKSIQDIYKSEASPELITDINSKFTDWNKLSKQLSKTITLIEFDSGLSSKIELLDKIIDVADSMPATYKTGFDILGDKFNQKNIGFLSKLFSKPATEAQKHINELYDSFGIIVSDIEKFSKYEDLKIELKDWDDYSEISETLKDIKTALKSVYKQKEKLYKILSKSYDLVVGQVNVLKSHKDACLSIIECKKLISKTDAQLVSIFPLIGGISDEHTELDSYKTSLDSLAESLATLDERLPDLDAYNKWIKFYNTDKTLFQNLIKVPIDEWEIDFRGIYYYSFLLNFDAESEVGFHRDSSKLDLLRKFHDELQKHNIYKINRHWYLQRYKAIQDLESDPGFKTLFALKKNQRFGKRKSLRQIIEWDFDAFTSLFPVIMVNPIVANALLPLKQGLFDLVIFDEASQLRVEDIYTSMIRGKYKIIAGDQHQMPPSNYFSAGIDGADNSDTEEIQDGDKLRRDAQLDADSLLAFAETLPLKNMSYLDFHYRSKHPALINFSNAAFYGGNLCPLPVNGADYSPIVLREVDGVYKSKTKDGNINPDEAVEVLKILGEIKENSDGTMPSVGIATFNIWQRNYIKSLLNDAAIERPEFYEKYAKLQQSGLFVKNLENIQGDERDIMIISTTFGKDADGNFHERFASVGQEKGYRLMNVLVTRAKKQLFLVTSIPQSKYSKYKELIDQSSENNRKAIMYAYIAYAKAISECQIDAIANIISDLKQFSYDKPRVGQSNISDDLGGLTESPFEDEVYNEIVKIEGIDAIKPQYPVGGYRLDFLIEYNGHKIALECDGKAYHNSDQAYAADMHRQKWIENFGYKFHRIWSTNWFEDKSKEVVKFKRFLGSLK